MEQSITVYLTSSLRSLGGCGWCAGTYSHLERSFVINV